MLQKYLYNRSAAPESSFHRRKGWLAVQSSQTQASASASSEMGPEGLRLLLCVATISQPCYRGHPAWFGYKEGLSFLEPGEECTGRAASPYLPSCPSMGACVSFTVFVQQRVWLYIRPADTRHWRALFIDGGQAHRQERCISLATNRSNSWTREKAWMGAGLGPSPLQVGVKLFHTVGWRYWASSSLSTRKRA